MKVAYHSGVPRRRTALLFIIAVVAASWSGPLVRLADQAPPLAIALFRTGVATAVLIPFAALRKGELRRLTPRDVGLLTLGGAFLALHFATWIASVNMTTVAASVLLVGTTPIFVAIASSFLGEAPRPQVWVGIAVAAAGMALVGAADLSTIASAGTGNLLAVAGAAAGAGYITVGRSLRRRISLPIYATFVYGSCALIVLPVALASGMDLRGIDPTTLWVLLAIVVGPQLLGHTTYNFLLERTEATKIGVALMAEPIGATLIAALLFGEIPGRLVLPGAALVLAGIGLVIRSGSRRSL